MARGTLLPVNRAMLKPLMVAGVEKRLALGNALLSFPLVAATHFKLPFCLVGVGFFVGLHFLLVMVSQQDPHLGKLFKRSTRYSLRAYFAAKGHPLSLPGWKVKTIALPW